MAGTDRTIDWNGRTIHAWVPDPLAGRDLTLSQTATRMAEQAATTARRVFAQPPEPTAQTTSALIRAEAVASSHIEHVTAPPEQIAAAELDPTADGDAAWIADNITATAEAIADAHARTSPLDTTALHRWHRLLMTRASGLAPCHIGAFRDEVGWIGGTGPHDAVAVLPPPDTIAGLTEDLIAFANRTDLDPVVQAAVTHAQFESIHPYADGNGRVGRMLTAWLLARCLRLVCPPPVSVEIAKDTGGYLSGLALYRLDQLDPYVAWFAEKIERASAPDLLASLSIQPR